MRANWTSAQEHSREELTLEGCSASEIGAAIGKTRNAVIGRNNRMKRYGGPSLSIPKKNKRKGLSKPRVKRVRRVAKAPSMTTPKPVETASETTNNLYDSGSFHKTLLDRGTDECCWPTNDRDIDGEHLYCAHETEPGQSYCAHHHERLIAPVERTRQRKWAPKSSRHDLRKRFHKITVYSEGNSQ